jgi:UDP-N-acetylmuramoylalanine--D-glutamate ligase
MELSSFQLDFFGPWSSPQPNGHLSQRGALLFDASGWSPSVAAILNITPNHLDRHQTMDAYIAAKAQILAHQPASAAAVLNLDDPVTREMGRSGTYPSRRYLWFSLEQEVGEGAWLQGDHLALRWEAQEQRICHRQELSLLGRHNLANALAACALVAAVRMVAPRQGEAPASDAEPMGRVLTSFPGVEHRLELVRTRRGVRWYNDSIATSPERTIAALRSFEESIVLLAGGRDKHLPWEGMAALAQRKARHIVLFGEAADLIDAALHAQRDRATNGHATAHIHQAGTLQRAVSLAAELAEPGDVVLLSPGGTSFDAYPDFVARGEHFRQLVQDLE